MVPLPRLRTLVALVLACLLIVGTAAPALAGRTAAAEPELTAAAFCDVSPADPWYEAVTQLSARGIIRGYANGCFGPNDTTLRAQMAAMIARAMGWDAEDHGNRFPDRGGVDADLWRNVGTLAYYGVARGYPDGTYKPTANVLYAQTISFITRGMVAKGLWVPQADNAALYPNVPTSSGHRADIATYVAHAGLLPGSTSAGQSWVTWDQPATRAWFAMALWQAIAQATPPAPPPPPPPPPAGPTDAQLVAAAIALIDAVPEYRYIVDTLVARQVAWRFADLPPDVAGSYNFRMNLITYNAAFRTQDLHNLAAVAGHEGQHASDFFAYGVPRTEAMCYEFEFRGFVTGAGLWLAWYGPGGKPVPVNDFERFQNAVLADLLYNDGRALVNFILNAYAAQCGPLPDMVDAASVQDTGGPAPGTQGLPSSVVESFPNLDAALAGLARGVPSPDTAPLPVQIIQ